MGSAAPFERSSAELWCGVALTVLDTMLDTPSSSSPRPFIFISAADAFRPLVPSRYIETKRQAEIEIGRRCCDHPEAGVRPVFMRPGASRPVLAGTILH